jgi:hypothetical protein
MLAGRKVLAVVALASALGFSGCEKTRSGGEPPGKIKRANVHRTPEPVIPAAELRSALRAAYRLGPDRRFLLAFGEVRRLTTGQPGPPGTPARATYSAGRWDLELDGSRLGSLPELPDFPDFFDLLVAQAKAGRPGAGRRTAPNAARDAFLMPGLVKELQAAETAWRNGRGLDDVSRCFARMAFQMPDRVEVAPLVSARALALLAAARAADSQAGVEEEVLLAQMLGYTQHAERRARSLPPGSPLRLFEEQNAGALLEAASKPGASEMTRFLALEQATADGDIGLWKTARARLFPDDRSASVISTGVDLALPAQLEVSERKQLIDAALQKAVVAEIRSQATPDAGPGVEEALDFDALLKEAASSVRGFLWDGPAFSAYYEAAYHGPWLRYASESYNAELGHGSRTSQILVELGASGKPSRPDAEPVGMPFLIGAVSRSMSQGASYDRLFGDIRQLVKSLDSRPGHRAALAVFSHYNLMDILAAEELHRSLLRILGDGSRKQKAESAIYVGDWTAVERILNEPQTQAPAAGAILWAWTVSEGEPDRRDRQFVLVTEKFPHDWNLTSYYLEALRSRRKYGEGCELLERWLRRNGNPRTPGYFHAHVRLGHNYALAREYEKGLSFLQGFNQSEPFQQTIIKRGIAENLAGTGRLAEAETLLREVVRYSPYDAENVRDLVRVLWAEDKLADAASTLVDPQHRLTYWDRCGALGEDFVDVFEGASQERLRAAAAAAAKHPDLLSLYDCAPAGLAKVGRAQDAMTVAEQFPVKGSARIDALITRYGYMKAWKGQDAAEAWLRQQVPEGERNPLSMKALYTKNDEVLWDVLQSPEANDHPEWVWLFRACAFALRGKEGDPHRAELLAYYQRSIPDDYHVMGRFLVGLASEAELFELARTPQRSCEVAYYAGARAEGAGRFREACEWYRVAAESHASTSPRTLALRALGEWRTTALGIWKLEVSSRGKAGGGKQEVGSGN